MKSVKSVEEYIQHHIEWEQSLSLLRAIMQQTKLEEGVKWGAPIYTLGGKNVVGLAAFKSYVGIWFHHGALLKDKHKKLLNAQEGVTKALRQWRFNGVKEIEQEKEIILAYVQEAINNQQQGKVIKPAKNKPLILPEELKELLAADTQLSEKFDAFNLTKKREFSDYISEAKRVETKQTRLEKIKPLILEGVGLNDKYR